MENRCIRQGCSNQLRLQCHEVTKLVEKTVHARQLMLEVLQPRCKRCCRQFLLNMFCVLAGSWCTPFCA